MGITLTARSWSVQGCNFVNITSDIPGIIHFVFDSVLKNATQHCHLVEHRLWHKSMFYTANAVVQIDKYYYYHSLVIYENAIECHC